MSNSKTTSSGVSFTMVLFFIFLILKLTGTITWSWWWVTAPLWGGLALVVLLILIVALFYTIFKGSS